MSGVGITYLWLSKEFPPFIRLEGKRGDYEVYTPERTCEIESSFLNDFTSEHECWYEFEMQCGYRFTWDEMEPPRCCPNCGAKVVDA